MVAPHERMVLPYDSDYQLVAASQLNAIFKGQSGVGGQGDVIEHLIIVPETLTPGLVQLKDGTDAAFNVFNTGVGAAGLNSELRPFVLRLGIRSRVGAWQITTGAQIHVIAVGRAQ